MEVGGAVEADAQLQDRPVGFFDDTGENGQITTVFDPDSHMV